MKRSPMVKKLARYTDNELIYLSHLKAESLRLFVECGRDIGKLKAMKGYYHAGYTLHTQLMLALYYAKDIDREAYILAPIRDKENELNELVRLKTFLPKRIEALKKQLKKAQKQLKSL